MDWETPVTAWPVGPVGAADYDRIEGNIAVLHKGSGQATIATAVAAETLALPNDTDETFDLSSTGAEVIKYISTNNRQPGNHIHLIVSGGGASLYNNGSSAPGDAAKIYVRGTPAGGSSYFIYQHQLITLVFNGVAWFCNVN
jgi:hypothetical protein